MSSSSEDVTQLHRQLSTSYHGWHMKWYWEVKPNHSEKICPNATVSTTHPTWTGLGLKSGLCSERLAAKCTTLPQNKFKKIHVSAHLDFTLPSHHEHSIHNSDTVRSRKQINEAELVHVNVCLKHTNKHNDFKTYKPNFNIKYRTNLKTTWKIWNFSNIMQQVKVLLITSMLKKHNFTYMQPTNLDTPRQMSSKVMQ
jgi:hypothetical protein